MNSPSNIVLGSFIGDALALGPHWIYNQSEIFEKLGRVTDYHPPLASYHPGKAAGDLTHYGDQALVLLRSIAENGRFDLPRYTAAWREFWENPDTTSYRDHATQETLANLQTGVDPAAAASGSDDMAGAAKIAPLLLAEWDDDAELFAAARAVAGFTHGDPAVIEAAEFFARVALAVQRGDEIPVALEEIMALHHWEAIHVGWLQAGLISTDSPAPDVEVLKGHGLTCHTPEAFPGICHLLLKYPDDPATALIENASAGGDNAARGMILGLVYGAKFPVSGWRPEWLTGLRARSEIESLIELLE